MFSRKRDDLQPAGQHSPKRKVMEKQGPARSSKVKFSGRSPDPIPSSANPGLKRGGSKHSGDKRV